MLKGIEFLREKSMGFKTSPLEGEQRSVAYSNKVVDSRRPQPVGCGGKNDVSGWGFRYILSAFCQFFKYPSLADKSATSLSRGEVSYGRSMIEMLGVLAVIAVLTTGGIAGYSKAMLMWHSNMQRNSLSELLHNMLSIKSNLNKTMPWQHFAGIIDAMGYTPEGLTLVNNGNDFIDRDGNLLDVQYGIDDTNGGLIYRLYIFLGQQSKNYTMSARDYCHNVALVSQSIINDLQGIYVYYFGEKDGQEYGLANWLFKPQNLKTMKMTDIHNACAKAIPDDVKRISHITISLNPL